MDLEILAKNLYFVYQPIYYTANNEIIGYECLLRGVDKVGFESIFDFFDFLYKEKILHLTDLKLREKAIKDFLPFFKKGKKLFYNIDSRIIEHNDTYGNTKKLLNEYGIDENLIVFEISERFKLKENIYKVVNHYKNQGFKIALDDFGVGNICFESVLNLKIDFLKIDGMFIKNIQKSFEKKEIIRALTKLCNILNIRVIAEKVEHIDELYTLNEMNIEYLQGYLIEKPAEINKVSTEITLNVDLKLKRESDQYKLEDIKPYLKTLPVVNINDSPSTLAEIVKNGIKNVILIVNKNNYPLYLLDYKSLYKLIYNKYYYSLYFERKDRKVKDLIDFFQPVYMIDIKDFEKEILESLLNLKSYDYFIVMENNNYLGAIHYKDLVELVIKNKVYEALDRNPLTKLSGNLGIKKYMEKQHKRNKDFYMCYFDFNNFKVYNDKYGFRNGDRVILLFSEIMKKECYNDNFFLGHIGGDDFILCGENLSFQDFYKKVKKIRTKFKDAVYSFYSREDRENGFIAGVDRDGNIKKFPLLNVSASILYIPHESIFDGNADSLLASSKKKSKKYNIIDAFCLSKQNVKSC